MTASLTHWCGGALVWVGVDRVACAACDRGWIVREVAKRQVAVYRTYGVPVTVAKAVVADRLRVDVRTLR